MNVKRFVLSCVAVYVVYQILGFLVHQVFLGETYASLASVWRPEADAISKMWIQFLTSLVWVVLFCFIFTRGYEGKGPVEGVRYGSLVGLMIGIPYAYVSYMIYPITLPLAHSWAIVSVVVSVICGFVLAMI